MPSSLETMLSRHSDALAGVFLHSDVPSLRDALAPITDPRARRGVRYAFVDVLLVFVAAVLSGAKSLIAIEEWAQDDHQRSLLPAWKRVPSPPTFHRVAALVDSEAFDTAISGWTQKLVSARSNSASPNSAQRSGALHAVAIDGKEVRGAKHASGARTFLMAAFDHASGIVIEQESVGEKTNEIPHLPRLLDKLGDLTDTVITVDALHTLPQQAEAIMQRGGHYLFTVKGNAKKLRERISEAPWGQQTIQYQRVEKAHGRTSTWEAIALPATTRINFPGAKQIMQLRRGRNTNGHATGETVYVITSLPPQLANTQQLAQLLRGHWGIENRLHWVRDTAWGEDTSQVRTGTAAHMMASVRNLGLSIHRIIGHTNITKALRTYAKRPELAIQITRL
jgi:predicted transposase YbfD/YdcC